MHALRSTYCAALLCGALVPTVVFAQANYPARPVTMVFPYSSGAADVEARIHARYLSKIFGQSFVVEDRPGAGTTLGTGYVAKSAPDGYTLLIASGSHTIMQWLYKDLGFDPIKDFTQVYMMSSFPTIIVVTPAFPAKTIHEYIAYAKANPGKINWGTGGAGGSGHLVGARLGSETGTTTTFVHYKVFSALQGDLFTGRVDIADYGLQTALPQLKTGQVRALAVTGDQRSALLPNVPTVTEEPGLGSFSVANWTGYLAPAGTPQPVVAKLTDALAHVAQEAEVKTYLVGAGGVSVNGTPADFRRYLINESESWRAIIQKTGIKLEE